ncbi:DNA phosphorothioation-dependent restriction protein DptH [Neptunomonas qingdaonensis]|uniref:DNA phosphorothioation-dependent restriction protein DptH n=1 Tax=Neptunomonas qingdaonensis TaxID=1045558 RepID=A0A1I2TV28_9GAMM|nr:DNA phosphorothioation-dependent restriction protein DptH [Neptunomonas qingdaonensis]SFG68752.1 DNA phosphorothioation-dependent restriction protein DptH [Neptunomonas qingdaonensis]
MSVKRFENFIATQFATWAPNHVSAGERFQFKSPSQEIRKKIYRALIELAGDNSVSYKVESISDVISMPYLDLNGLKVLPLLHSDDDDGFNEHFLAHLRDEPESDNSLLSGMALLFLHNSTLDTIVNSSDDLAYEGGIWHPSSIKTALTNLIDEQNDAKGISNCLLDYQFDAISEDGATMFGFEKLYNSLEDGEIEFHELELFNDPFIKELSDDTDQIKKRLEKNRQLYRSIEHDVEHFSGQLQSRLKQFGSKFIAKHFPKGDLKSWKDVHFQTYLDEINRNSQPTLVFDEITSEQCESIARSSGTSKAAERKQHIIIQVPANEMAFDFTATFFGNDLDTNQLTTPNRLLPLGHDLKATKGSKHCKLTVKGPFDGTPLFFTVGTGGRDRSTEKFDFHCLVIRKGDFYIEGFQNIYTISAKAQIINLHTNEYFLTVNPSANQRVELEECGESALFTTTAEVHFKELANDSELIDFKINSGLHRLHFNVEGEVATESLSLPLLFDRDRFSRLFRDSYYGEFSRRKDKVLIDNKEVTPVSVRLTLLRWEADFLDQELIALNHEGNTPLSSLLTICPELHNAYQSLFSYLSCRETLPSLVSWGDEYRDLVHQVVSAYQAYLEQIEIDTVPTNADRLVLQVGMVKSEDCEHFSPFHPLILSYFVELADQIVADGEESSFKYLPRITLERLSPRGLIPYLYDNEHAFSYVQLVKENPVWLKAIPHEDSNYDYVRKVVREKIGEFQNAFSQLFSHNGKSKLLINAINQQQCKELLLGIVDYFAKNLDNACCVHVNLYDEQLQFNWFDDFAELASHSQLKEKLGLNKKDKKEIADTLIDTLRTQLTYSKFTHKEAAKSGHAYAHIAFFRNEEKIQPREINIDASISGISADGLLSGEGAESKGNSYFTAFGLRNVPYKLTPHLKLARLYGALIVPARKSSTPYTGSNAIALAVNEGFQKHLEQAYEASIWTTIIDPKVTLDFFRNQNLTLIHFSDQYTTTAGYDAITVTREIKLYRRVLEQGQGGLIEEFNAFNGDWLLKMLTASKSSRKGIEGEIGAYKFVTSMLSESDITWVPLSIGEMVRVSGNIGLRIMESEFAPGAHSKNEGPMSDDILLVGFKDQQLFLLPVEVKTGKPQGTDKAIAQIENLLAHLQNMLGRRSLANKIYRALFMRQVLIQVDKYQLYDVFTEGYFSQLLAEREEWTRGEYRLATLEDYPEGIVVQHIDGQSIPEPSYKEVGAVLCIELPTSLLSTLVGTSLKGLMHEKNIKQLCHVPTKYILGSNLSINEFNISSNDSRSELKQPLPQVSSNTSGVSQTQDTLIETDTRPDKTELETNSDPQVESNFSDNDILKKQILRALSGNNQLRLHYLYRKTSFSREDVSKVLLRNEGILFGHNNGLWFLLDNQEKKVRPNIDIQIDNQQKRIRPDIYVQVDNSATEKVSTQNYRVQNDIGNYGSVKTESSSGSIDDSPEYDNTQSHVRNENFDTTQSESIDTKRKLSGTSNWSGQHLSVLLGHRTIDKAPIFWEPTNTNKVFNTNTGIIGTMGTGKTQFTKSLITQLVRQQKDNVDGKPLGILIFDYKADYIKEDFVKATNATVYGLHHLPFNPFSLVGNKPMLPVHTASLFRATLAKAFGLGPKQEHRIHELVMQAYENCGIQAHNPASWTNNVPTMQNIWDLFLDQEKVEQDSLYAALYELNTFEVFEPNSEKTQSLYDTLNGVTVINLSGYDKKIQNLVVAITLDIFFAQMHQHGSSKLDGDYRQISKMILVDEADNFMSQQFESLKKILKEGREFGVGTILSTQELTHFKAGDMDYSKYILSWIIHRVSQLKSQEIKAIFNSADKNEEERFMQQIRQLDKHYSLYVDGEKKVSKIKDKAFWELLDQ